MAKFSKKQIIWHKTSVTYKVTCKKWYDLEDWFKCFYNFRTVAVTHGHAVYSKFSNKTYIKGIIINGNVKYTKDND